jgi:glycine cleavage system H protein
MEESNFLLPDDRFYDENYTWIQIKDDIISVGIIKPAADLVKEFVFISLPQKATKVKKGDVFISVEAIKWSGHMKSPVSGTIIDVNEDLFDSPGKINKNPYDEWIVKIKVENMDELKLLMTSTEKMKKPLKY